MSDPAPIRWGRLNRTARRALLIPLLAKGMSYSEIAAQTETTRHCIAGFIYRNMQDVENRPRHSKFTWSKDQTVTLAALSILGKKPVEIAAAIPGVTYSQVYEKLRLLRLIKPKGEKKPRAEAKPKAEAPRKRTVAEANTQRNKTQAIQHRMAAPMVLKPVRMPEEFPDIAPKPFIARREGLECAWIVGDSRSPDPQCCGAPTSGDRSWCDRHRAIVFGLSPAKAMLARHAASG